MGTQPAKHILIAPLDWGLGHTTRCLPLIRHLLAGGHRVTLAGNASQLAYVQASLPGLPTTYLQGYDVTYAPSGRAFMPHLLRQMPRILGRIRSEHRWLRGAVQRLRPDGIISDNRYGLHHPGVPTVILTHQLCIQTGMGALPDALMYRLHRRLLARFGQTWLVDVPGAPNLSGSLAQPPALPARTTHIGWLSHLYEPDKPPAAPPAEGHLLVLLSGPEPQRSLLAAQLWPQLCRHRARVVFVAGSPSASRPADVPEHISWHGRLERHALRPLIAGAAMVICRSGYSSLMDLLALGRRAILIPTPGQTEQEYLARYLQGQGMFFAMPQQGFELETALAAAASCTCTLPAAGAGFRMFEPVLDAWVAGL